MFSLTSQSPSTEKEDSLFTPHSISGSHMTLTHCSTLITSTDLEGRHLSTTAGNLSPTSQETCTL